MVDGHQRAVVVSGLGAVTAFGFGCRELWRGLEEGRIGLRRIRRFDPAGLATDLAGLVPGYDDREGEWTALCLELALAAAQEALDHSRLDRLALAERRVALVCGASMGEGGRRPDQLAEALAEALSLRGPRLTVSTACASSLTALGLARDILRAGEAELVLAGGADRLTPELLAGFSALGALSEGPCAPFSQPLGTSLGEGAGFLVLELQEAARARGLRPQWAVLGYGLSGDAHHETTPHPRGDGVSRALRSALGDAGLEASAIGYVNAHGTGTAANDGAEAQAIRRVFGPGEAVLPVSSSKGHLGHAQGAAGALEVIVTLLGMERGCLPPTASFTAPRPQAPSDPVAEAEPRPGRFDRALSLNSAFGGANGAVALGVAPAADTWSPPRPVFVLGAGALGASGEGAEAALAATLAGHRLDLSPRPLRLHRSRLRRADPRGLDPAAVMLSSAAAMALEQGGLVLAGEARARAGVIVGMTHTSPQSAAAFERSRRERGLARVSTTAFARLVLNASQGTCAKLLSLKGYQTTLAAGSASGLVALWLGAEVLARRGDVDHLVVGAVEESLEGPEASAEGAGCLLLGAAPGQAPVRVVAWSLLGADELDRVLEVTLERGDLGAGDVGALFGRGALETRLPGRRGGEERLLVDPRAAFGDRGALPTAMASVAAVTWLRRQPVGAVAVIIDAGPSAASGVVLLRREGEEECHG